MWVVSSCVDWSADFWAHHPFVAIYLVSQLVLLCLAIYIGIRFARSANGRRLLGFISLVWGTKNKKSLKEDGFGTQLEERREKVRQDILSNSSGAPLQKSEPNKKTAFKRRVVLCRSHGEGNNSPQAESKGDSSGTSGPEE